MSKTISFNTRDTEEVKNRNIKGINVVLNLVHKINNTDFVAADVDLSKINVEVVLYRRGAKHEIGKLNLRDWVSFSNWRNNMFFGARDVTQILRTTLAKDTSVKTTCLVPLYIRFGGPINLHPGDRLITTITSTLAAVSSTNVDTSNSVIYFSAQDTDEIELAIPKVHVEVLQQNQKDPSIALGDNVLEVQLINYDLAITNYLDATKVVNSLSLRSHSLTRKMNFDDLLVDQFLTTDDADASPVRGQSFMLYEGGANRKDKEHLDEAVLDLDLISANVTASNNVVVWNTFKIDPHVIVNAQHVETLKAQRVQHKINKAVQSAV